MAFITKGQKSIADTNYDVFLLKELHVTTWRQKGDWFWFLRLLPEIVELGLSLVGLHKHTPDQELSQIAAVCLNWLEMRQENERNA